jgi:hypothetical protein
VVWAIHPHNSASVTLSKLTFSSIQPHKATVSIRVSPLRRALSKSRIQSPPITFPPPFLSYLSEFSIVFHENCTVGKLTFSSIQQHKATLSIRVSPLRRVLSKNHIGDFKILSLSQSYILLISPEVPVRPPSPSTLNINAFCC